jgi:hypothetical protein
MRRRIFVATALTGLAAFVGWRTLASSDYDAIVAIIEKRLHYLRKDPDGVRAFARDLAGLHQISSAKIRVVSIARPLYENFALDGDNRFMNGIHHGEERVISGYLLSSDFFANGADESRLVRYLGMYDPLRACGNPFARLADA